MAIERTFSIIKPDATKRNLTGKIIDRFESNGLRIIASKRIHMTREQAGGFYAVHKERPFYNDLVDFMVSGPVVVQVLKAKTPLPKTAKLWVQPIRQKPMRAPFAKILPRALMPIPYTALTHLKRQRKKSSSSSRMTNWSANSRPGLIRNGGC